MSWTLRSSNNIQTGGFDTTIAVTVTGVVAGDLVVAYTANDIGTTMTVSDGTSSLTGLTLGSFGGGVRGQLFRLLSSIASGSVTYTTTYGASASGRQIHVYVFQPSGTVSADDEDASGDSGTSVASPNITTIGTDELIFGAGLNENANTWSARAINAVAATGSLTAANNSGTLWYTTAGAPFTGNATATLSASSVHVVSIASFSIAPPSNVPARVIFKHS